MKRQLSSLTLLALCAALGLGLLTPATGYAHDFGGPSTGGTGPDEPPPETPCTGDDCEPDCEEDGAGNPNSPPTAKSGKPVSLFTGAETISATDLIVDGVFPIRLARRYDSQSQFDSPLGFGWGWVFDRRLYEYADGSVVIRHGCGNRNRFVQSGGAYVTPPAGMPGTLSELPDGTFKFLHADGRKDFYDLQGMLTATEDVRGNRHEYTYDPAGKLPMQGAPPYNRLGVSPPGGYGNSATSYRLTRIDERATNGALTGHYVAFAYGSQGRLASATTNDGRVVIYGHESTATMFGDGECPHPVGFPTTGNLRRVTYPDLAVVDYEYGFIRCSGGPPPPFDQSAVHRLLGVRNSSALYLPPLVANAYDSGGKVVFQNVRGTQYGFEYLIPYSRTRVTKTVQGTGDAGNPGGYTAVTTYDFDSVGRVTKITDALGNEQRFAYNSAKFLESKEIWQNNSGTLSRLQSTSWTYDGAGNMLTESTTLDGGEVVTESWTYDHGWIASEQVLSSASPSKIFRTEYTFFYNSDGFPKNIHQVKRRRDDGSFQTTTYDYDSRNRYKGVTRPDGVREAVDYTGEFVTKSYVEVGGVEVPQLKATFERNARGNAIKTWDARGNLTERTFDAMGRVTTVTNPRGEQDIFEWVGGELQSIEEGRTVADGIGQVTRMVYDMHTRRVTNVQRRIVSGQFVNFQSYGLNSEGDVVTQTDAENRTRHASYDVLGRMNSVTDALGKTTTFAYDAANNLTRITDALSRQTRLEYDDLNRRTAVVDVGVSPNPRTEYTYDADSNMTSVRDAEDRVTTYEFDALSRNTRITQPLGQQTQFFYDNRDRIDYLLTARNQKIDYDYESWGPVREEKQYPTASATTADRTISYSLDNDGNPTSVSDSSVQTGSTYGFTYDSLGRIYDETVRYLPGGDRTLQHRYDRFGNRSELTVVDGGSTAYNYTYDRYFNRLTNATLAGAPLSLTYFANDERQTIALPNGVSRSFTYKANGPVNTIEVSGPGGLIAQQAYSYDDALNVDTLTDADGIHDYGYDGLNRLTSVTHPAPSGLPPNEVFTFTPTGNRKDAAAPGSWTFDNNHRITASPGLTYGHDADGNMQSRSDSMTLTHDARQRLTQVLKSGTTSSYLHDPFGRRIRKTVGGTSTWYLWDGTQLLSEYNGAGIRTKRYGYLPGGYAPIQAQDVNGTYYVHTDHLDTPRLITNASAQTVWRARYESFGRAMIQEDPDGNGVPVSFNLRFPGQYFDSETGLHYNLMRDYDPERGRYIQADPFGQLANANLFGYAGSNPANDLDPTGEILPAIAAYLRCVAQCTAVAAVIGELTDPCFSFGDALGDCALSCANPLNWFRFDKILNVVKNARSAAAAQQAAKAQAAAAKAKRNSKEKEALIDMAEADRRRGITPDDMQAYKDLNKDLPDPFPTDKVRGPEAHPTGGPHSQAPHGHVGPVDHIPIRKP